MARNRARQVLPLLLNIVCNVKHAITLRTRMPVKDEGGALHTLARLSAEGSPQKYTENSEK